MEKIPAACAMEWSIQLEKALRRNNPGKSIEALKEIGSRLEKWNNESNLTIAECKMFDLISGEDKLFLNSIFLRLAQTFTLGSKQVKNEVVKLFLNMKRRRKRDEEGIISKVKLENHLELLRRVKEVFDRGDAEERALALVLFGCWADITKDSADVRYIVLSSLVSDDVLEVKASLFAAGCLCEVADDFANVFLEMLNTMVSSPNISKDIKLAGGRAFAKKWCSFSMADKAYKIGLKLLMESSDDDFSVVMLISLSRIASQRMLLIPNQIELLSSFLSEERPLHIQTTSLRCHHFIVARGVCYYPSTKDTAHNLFTILQSSRSPPALQLEAFKILHKILLFNLSTINCTEIPELFLKLLSVVGNMVQSPDMSTRVLAVNVLADLSVKLLGREDILYSGIGPDLQVVSFVLDQALLLLAPNVDYFEREFEIKSLLSVPFNLVEKHPNLSSSVLGTICLFIDKLMKMLEIPEFASHNKTLDKSKLMLYLSKIIVSCLKNLEASDAESHRVLDELKLQAEKVCHCSYFGSYTSTVFSLLLHLHATYINENASLSCVDSVSQLDILTMDCAKNMLNRKSYWPSYKAGKIAACQGVWATAGFIFEQLVTEVESDSCNRWLKSLAIFSALELKIQFFLRTGEKGGVDIFLKAHNVLLSAEETLADSDTNRIFSFQRWFLTLRAKFLKNVAHLTKLLDSVSSIRDGGNLLLPCISSSHRFDSLIHDSTEVSLQMRKLGQEFDFLLMSFMGMDRESVAIVSSLALSCSLMAFTARFAFPIRNMDPKSENLEGGNLFHALLVDDLIGRLCRKDNETRGNLKFLTKNFRKYRSHSSPGFRAPIFNTTPELRVLHKLCEYSVRDIVNLHNEATLVQQDGEALFKIVNDGSRILSNVLSKSMSTSFRTPRHFFRVKSPVSSELFMMNEDGKNIDGASVLQGFHLSLNMCLQLKNMPPGPPGPLNKVHCVLTCKKNSNKTTESEECNQKSHFSRNDQKIDDMVVMNQNLMRYAIGSVKNDIDQVDDRCVVNEYVRFELNERGQGFNSCLLDVSAFPVGCYRIKWHSGFIDSGGCYWSLWPENDCPVFTVRDKTGAK